MGHINRGIEDKFVRNFKDIKNLLVQIAVHQLALSLTT